MSEFTTGEVIFLILIFIVFVILVIDQSKDFGKEDK